MTAAYVYHLDAASPAVQSGRPHSILLNFRKFGMDVEQLFPLAEEGVWPRKLRKIGNLLRYRQYLLDRDSRLLRGFARQLHERLQHTEADFIFSPSTLPLSYLETDLPITFCADAPFCALKNYYDSFTRLTARQIDLSEELEARVLKRAALAVYPTQWAADLASAHYGVPPERIAVFPFGANFGRANRRADVEQWIEGRTKQGTLRLLFVGREWERKGGPVVMETADWLKGKGIDFRVDFVGCSHPVTSRRRPYVFFHGALSPRDPDQAARLAKLYQNAHILFVPSLAEAYGMTFSEANAFGLPTITRATGGIPGIIRSGVNGHALPNNAGPAEYGQAILDTFNPRSSYREYCLRAYAEFEGRTNWEIFARDFIAHPVISSFRASPDSARAVPSRPAELKSAPNARMENSPEAAPRRIRVAFLANEYLSPENVRSWSGLPFHMCKAMERVNIEVAPVTVKSAWGGMGWLKFAYWRCLRNRRYLRQWDTLLLRSYGRQAGKKLAEMSADAVFTPSSWMIAHLETSLPVILWSDATFANVLNFYKAFSNLAPPSIREGHAAERAALRRCSVALFSSEWAAKSAVGEYGIPSDRVEVLAFGANIEQGVTEAELESVIAARPADRCRLLFVGVDWERKGADLTVEIVRCLHARGLAVDLTIVGCQAPVGASLPSGVEVTGFISKATAEGRQRFDALCRQSHLFIMPTRADCTPCVYGEANNYALPCIGTDVGGVGSVIIADVNGRAFPLEAPPEEYADYIANLLSDRARYERLCRSAWAEGQNRLSWRHSAERIKTLLGRLCATGKGAPA